MIIVTGVGRSGTTFTARCLHELGVGFNHGDDPHFEDPELRQLLADAWGRRGGADPIPVRRELAKYFDRRMADAAAIGVGVKDPRLLDFGPEAWAAARPFRPDIVVCRRAYAQVLSSWARVTAASPSKAAERIELRSTSAEWLAALARREGLTVLVLDFSERRSETETKLQLMALPSVQELGAWPP